jgi:hypothetical protein
MARAKMGDNEAWRIVKARYTMAHSPNIKKHGITWVIKFNSGLLGETREMHIKDDGMVVSDERVGL